MKRSSSKANDLARTTIAINQILDHNLDYLALAMRAEGKPKSKSELVEEAIILLLKEYGLPTDKIVQVSLPNKT